MEPDLHKIYPQTPLRLFSESAFPCILGAEPRAGDPHSAWEQGMWALSLGRPAPSAGSLPGRGARPKARQSRSPCNTPRGTGSPGRSGDPRPCGVPTSPGCILPRRPSPAWLQAAAARPHPRPPAHGMWLLKGSWRGGTSLEACGGTGTRWQAGPWKGLFQLGKGRAEQRSCSLRPGAARTSLLLRAPLLLISI